MEHVDANDNNKVVLITSKQNTEGIVSIPGLGFSQPFSVQANQVAQVEVPLGTEFIGSETVKNIGINLSSNLPVSVYIHQYHGSRSEATLVLPNESISTAYYVMSYAGISAGPGDGFSEFLIVATQDETTVNYQLTDNTQGGKISGQTASVTLDKGETYQVKGQNTFNDLTGSFIEGDKPFAVFAGASFAGVPSFCPTYDNLLEQMTPIDTWGTRFVSVPTTDSDEDILRILAAENSTTVNRVTQSGTMFMHSLNKGEYVEYDSDSANYIESDKPIVVAQYLIGQGCIESLPNQDGDPSMLLLNSVEQLRDTVTLFNSHLQNITIQFINLICRTDDIDIVKFDGALVQADLGLSFTPIGSAGEFSFLRIPTTSGSHTITDPGCGVIATAYGFGANESYAYSGGASFSKINSNQLPEGGCRGIDVTFSSGLPPDRYELEWDIGDGQPLRTDDDFTYTYENLGTYPSQLIIFDKCFNERDTLNRDMIITLRQAVDAIDEIELCEDEPINFEVTDSGINIPTGGRVSFEWIGPLDYFAEEQYPQISAAKPEMSGTYEVVGIVSGCATFPDSTEVNVNPTPTHELGESTTLCIKTNKIPVLDGGNFESYLWTNNGKTERLIDADEAGEYILAFTDDKGCVGSDSISIQQQCPTQIYMSNVFLPDGTLSPENKKFGVLGADIISFKFSIYDRWGNIVFASEDIDNQWDGKINGKLATQGNYSWILQYEGYEEDGSTFQKTDMGSVLLLRN